MCMKCNESIHYKCECGKIFEKVRQLTGHQSNCKVHLEILRNNIEKRRLPNGLFKCENPECSNEHDGSYGSGRFCSKECASHIASKKSYESKVKNGTYVCNFNHKNNNERAPHGTWICKVCGIIFETRRLLSNHIKDTNHRSHNNGCVGTHLSEERKQHLRNINRGRKFSDEVRRKMSLAALKRTIPVSTKKTEPYTCVDGTIVNLDSSYERSLAKILDDNNIKWIRPKPIDWIDSSNITHHYYPDFYLVDYNIYLDPKNEYCFKVQSEKIHYIINHYPNAYFLHKDQITIEYVKQLCIKEQYRSSHNGAAC